MSQEGEKKTRKKNGKRRKNALAATMIANQPFPTTFSSEADHNAPSTTKKTAKKQTGTRMWTFQTVRKTSVMKQVLLSFFVLFFF
jgi:hypothetical protein